jgi:pyruvate/2-oxoglutarate dehydrogenase complex dihydrolipoamide dehydrogenase (E3) component
MRKRVDVAVIGAGHAGLNAIKEIRKVTDDWVLINGGPLGTTCARIGCNERAAHDDAPYPGCSGLCLASP